MKTLLINTRNITMAALFAVASISSVHATDGKNPAGVEMKYVSTINNQSLVELAFSQDAADNEYVVIIRDQYKNVLYKEFVKAGTFSKKYLLTEELGDISLLQFEVTNKKTDKTDIFQVNRSSRVVEDLVVNKLK